MQTNKQTNVYVVMHTFNPITWETEQEDVISRAASRNIAKACLQNQSYNLAEWLKWGSA
jgi:hypothetical protein